MSSPRRLPSHTRCAAISSCHMIKTGEYDDGKEPSFSPWQGTPTPSSALGKSRPSLRPCRSRLASRTWYRPHAPCKDRLCPGGPCHSPLATCSAVESCQCARGSSLDFGPLCCTLGTCMSCDPSSTCYLILATHHVHRTHPCSAPCKALASQLRRCRLVHSRRRGPRSRTRRQNPRPVDCTFDPRRRRPRLGAHAWPLSSPRARLAPRPPPRPCPAQTRAPRQALTGPAPASRSPLLALPWSCSE